MLGAWRSLHQSRQMLQAPQQPQTSIAHTSNRAHLHAQSPAATASRTGAVYSVVKNYPRSKLEWHCKHMHGVIHRKLRCTLTHVRYVQASLSHADLTECTPPSRPNPSAHRVGHTRLDHSFRAYIAKRGHQDWRSNCNAFATHELDLTM